MTSPKADPLFVFWTFSTVNSERAGLGILSFLNDSKGMLGPHSLPQVPAQSTGHLAIPHCC